jgi:hypothetical protein
VFARLARLGWQAAPVGGWLVHAAVAAAGSGWDAPALN